MIPRALRVSVAILATLTAASVCLAAEPEFGPGKGGVGGQVGFSYFRPDRAFGNDWFGDYSEGANTRFAFQGHWRYAMTKSLRWQVAPGLTWSAYGRNVPAPLVDRNFPDAVNKNEYLTLLMPVSVQLHYVVRRGMWLYYGGAGPGVYRVWVENRRKVLKDPETLKLHRGLYTGGSAQFGVERFLRSLPTTSLEASFGGHLVLCQRDDQFPSGFASNLMSLEVRVGGNYYFAPGDRKKKAEAPKPAAP